MSKMKQYLLTHPHVQMKNAHTFPSSGSNPYHPSSQFLLLQVFYLSSQWLSYWLSHNGTSCFKIEIAFTFSLETMLFNNVCFPQRPHCWFSSVTRENARMRAKSLQAFWLATLWAVVRQAPLSTGFPRQEYWSGLSFLISSSRGSFWPRDWTHVPGINNVSPALAGRFFTTEHLAHKSPNLHF